MQEANVSNSEERDSKRSAGLWATIFTWAGAVASIALIVGVAFWTYHLGLRDAMDVPIIQAMAGPAKVAPEDPGGKVVPHQGLAVNEVLAGKSGDKLATLRVAPEGDDLSDEDAPQASLARLETVAKPVRRPTAKKEFVSGSKLVQVKASTNSAPAAQGVDPLGPSSRIAEVDLPVFDDSKPFEIRIEPVKKTKAANRREPKLANAPQQVLTKTAPDSAPVRVAEPEPAPVVAEAKPEVKPEVEVATQQNEALPKPPMLNVEQAIAEVQAEQDSLKEVELASLDTSEISGSAFAPALATGPTPRKRRAAVNSPSTQPADTDLASREDDRQDVKPGTRMVQLGAYGSEAIAKRQWDVIVAGNSDLLGEKQRYIQRTKSNGKTFYRLRATSYPTLAATRAACSALSARGVPCIPTVLK